MQLQRRSFSTANHLLLIDSAHSQWEASISSSGLLFIKMRRLSSSRWRFLWGAGGTEEKRARDTGAARERRQQSEEEEEVKREEEEEEDWRTFKNYEFISNYRNYTDPPKEDSLFGRSGRKSWASTRGNKLFFNCKSLNISRGLNKNIYFLDGLKECNKPCLLC